MAGNRALKRPICGVPILGMGRPSPGWVPGTLGHSLRRTRRTPLTYLRWVPRPSRDAWHLDLFEQPERKWVFQHPAKWWRRRGRPERVGRGTRTVTSKSIPTENRRACVGDLTIGRSVAHRLAARMGRFERTPGEWWDVMGCSHFLPTRFGEELLSRRRRADRRRRSSGADLHRPAKRESPHLHSVDSVIGTRRFSRSTRRPPW